MLRNSVLLRALYADKQLCTYELGSLNTRSDIDDVHHVVESFRKSQACIAVPEQAGHANLEAY